MAGYLILTTAYSVNLKRRIVIDVCVLAGLYTIRIVAGGVATGIPLSVWLLVSMFLFFALAAVKRQANYMDTAGRGVLSASGRGYHVDDLPIISMMAIGAGYVSVLVLALYVNSPAVLELYSHPAALWGICCVLLYWITRTVMVAHRGHMHDDPVVMPPEDRISHLPCSSSPLPSWARLNETTYPLFFATLPSQALRHSPICTSSAWSSRPVRRKPISCWRSLLGRLLDWRSSTCSISAGFSLTGEGGSKSTGRSSRCTWGWA